MVRRTVVPVPAMGFPISRFFTGTLRLISLPRRTLSNWSIRKSSSALSRISALVRSNSMVHRGIPGNAAEADPARSHPRLCAESRGRLSAHPGEPRHRRSPGDARLANLPRAGGDLLRRAVPSERSRSRVARGGLPSPCTGQGRHRPRGRAGVARTARGLGGRRDYERPRGHRRIGRAAAPRSRVARAASPWPWVREPAGDRRWRGVGGTSAGRVRALQRHRLGRLRSSSTGSTRRCGKRSRRVSTRSMRFAWPRSSRRATTASTTTSGRSSPGRLADIVAVSDLESFADPLRVRRWAGGRGGRPAGAPAGAARPAGVGAADDARAQRADRVPARVGGAGGGRRGDRAGDRDHRRRLPLRRGARAAAGARWDHFPERG